MGIYANVAVWGVIKSSSWVPVLVSAGMPTSAVAGICMRCLSAAIPLGALGIVLNKTELELQGLAGLTAPPTEPERGGPAMSFPALQHLPRAARVQHRDERKLGEKG